jgi:dUTP pyrophosphatase
MKTALVKIKRLTNTATIPKAGTRYSAGVDLAADITKNILIKPNMTVKIPTGIAVELPEGTFGAIYARSGLATKQGLRPANCTGVIDSDYRGEIVVALYNDSGHAQIIEPRQRIAQMVVTPYISVAFDECEELKNTGRASGGFGSTGTK